jgi:hypothetical protein
MLVESRNAYKISAEKPEGRKPLAIPRSRWEYNTKINVKKVGWVTVDWILMFQCRDWWRALLNTVRNLRFP